MSSNDSNLSGLYVGREQTLVKHFLLDKYLERFAHIIGSYWHTITYVDCFSGPWNVRSDKLQDSSFYIAVNQLRRAKVTLAARGKELNVRCMFLEKDKRAYAKLEKFANDTPDAAIETRNASLEESIPDILEFVEQGGTASFPFVFIDPTGWTGFPIDVIKPLLNLRPGEVLVNFMTGHISRFAELRDPKNRKAFDGLFGPIDYRGRISGLDGQDREDELVRCYADALRAIGGFNYVCPSLVLHPEKNRTHFDLIYATRNLKGVEVFKQVEKKAMAIMEKARADTQQRSRVSRDHQPELFDSEAMHSGTHYASLRDRYLRRARDHILGLLKVHRRMLFEDVWVAALEFPLVWDSDLKAWIREWEETGFIRIVGLSEKERVPKCKQDHWIEVVSGE